MQDFYYLLAILLAVALPFILRARRRSHRQFIQQFSETEICEHLRPALTRLQSRGHAIVRAGQRSPEYPLEIHLAPPFDPQELADELKLTDPVFVSERNVLFCRDDFCELHPAKG